VNLDVSVAPELAQLMEPARPAGPRPDDRRPAGPRPDAGRAFRPTIGDLARELRQLTGAPDLWWSLVRFDAERPVRVPIPTAGAYRAWLSILPPAARDGQPCSCDVVTVVAGELTELTELTEPAGLARAGTPATVPATTKPLLPGQVRVHGRPGAHHPVSTGDGYTVSIHVRADPVPARSGQ
jgi:hypothetical protein